MIVLLGPILPPGNGSEQASGQVTDNTVLLAMATPVLLLVVLYLIYAVDRLPPAARARVLEGPAVRGDARLQTTWIVVTSVLVLVARRLRHGAAARRQRRRLGQRARRR